MATIPEDKFKYLLKQIPDPDKKSLLDYMEYLVERKNLKKDPYYEIKQRDPDPYPLNDEEKAQLNDPDNELMSLEELKRELGL